MTNLLNQPLGRYHIFEQLGEDGMAHGGQPAWKQKCSMDSR